MDNGHYSILEFLNTEGAVATDSFPPEISGQYNPGLGPGSLIYELEIVLKNKNWVKKINLKKYIITALGIAELNKQKSLIQLNQEVQEIEHKKRIYDFELSKKTLEDYDKVNKRSRDAIRIAYISVILSAIAIIITVLIAIFKTE